MQMDPYSMSKLSMEHLKLVREIVEMTLLNRDLYPPIESIVAIQKKIKLRKNLLRFRVFYIGI